MNNKNIDYKQKYKELKIKLRSLIHENQIYQDQLKQTQNEYLRLARDRDYLLDRLLPYENVSDSTDCTDESDTEQKTIKKNNDLNSATSSKKKKSDNLTQSKKKKSSVSIKNVKKLKSKPKSQSIIKDNETKLETNQDSLIDKQKYLNETKLIDNQLNINQLNENQLNGNQLNINQLNNNQLNNQLNDNQLNNQIDDNQLNNYQLTNFNQDKLFDDQKILFTNDLSTNLINNVMSNTRNELDTIDLNLDSLDDNLNSNLIDNNLDNHNLTNNLDITNSTNINLESSNPHLSNQLIQTFNLTQTPKYESHSNQTIIIQNNN